VSLFNPPSKANRYSLKLGMLGHDVGALQLNLNHVGLNLVVDGDFGSKTEKAVRQFQQSTGLSADGVAGAFTQNELAGYVWRAPQQSSSTPRGLIRGIVESESAYMVGAVNWNSPGGVDCGWVQRRVYEGSYSEEAFRHAFDGGVQFDLLAKRLRSDKERFASRGNGDERSWKLAALSHNWPWGADKLSRGEQLSTEPADWVKTASGGKVSTPAQWAIFYQERACRYVTTWPA
jgi:peptidoglycan hydrolase-like protein with peptidoglycan-binding domain